MTLPSNLFFSTHDLKYKKQSRFGATPQGAGAGAGELIDLVSPPPPPRFGPSEFIDLTTPLPEVLNLPDPPAGPVPPSSGAAGKRKRSSSGSGRRGSGSGRGGAGRGSGSGRGGAGRGSGSGRGGAGRGSGSGRGGAAAVGVVPAGAAAGGGAAAAGAPVFRLDLTNLVKSPFVIENADLDYLLDRAAPDQHTYKRLAKDMFWTMTRDDNKRFEHAASGHVVKRLNVHLGSGTYGDAFKCEFLTPDGNVRNCVMKFVAFRDENMFKDSITEAMTHYILQTVCRTNPAIQAGQLAGRMAKIPEILAAFTTRGRKRVHRTAAGPQYSNTQTAKYIVMIMEELEETGWAFLQSRVEKITHAPSFRRWTAGDKRAVVNTALAFLQYQCLNLLVELQAAVNFNHRDLHASNVMIIKDPTVPQKCFNTYFQAYIIDFGMSRLDYMGRTITNFGLFDVDRFNPSHDILMLMRSCRYALGCSIRTDRQCNYFNAVMNLMYREIMNASGLNFIANNHNTDGQTYNLYIGLQNCGEPLRLMHPPPTSVRLGQINQHKINPHTILQVLTVILQQLAVRCESGHHPFAPYGPAEAQEVINILNPPHAGP